NFCTIQQPRSGKIQRKLQLSVLIMLWLQLLTGENISMNLNCPGEFAFFSPKSAQSEMGFQCIRLDIQSGNKGINSCILLFMEQKSQSFKVARWRMCRF